MSSIVRNLRYLPADSPERLAYRAQVQASAALLPRLSVYRAALHGACEQCGYLLFAQVTSGYRCLHCMPPRPFPRALQEAIDATLPEKLTEAGQIAVNSTVFDEALLD